MPIQCYIPHREGRHAMSRCIGALLMNLLAAASANAQPDNLIAKMNPGFERADPNADTRPMAWTCRDGTGSARLVDEDRHSGRRCLFMESMDPMKPPGAHLPLIPVKPSTVYKLTYWARAEPGPDGTARGMVNVSFQYLDENRKSLPLTGTQYYGRIHVYVRSPSSEWTLYGGAVMSPPAARFGRVHVSPWRATGKAWYDDIVVQEDPAASAPARVPPETEGRVHYFDFGRKGAAVWPGFDEVSETTVYSSDKGFGWARSGGRRMKPHPDKGTLPGLRGLVNRSKYEPQRPDALRGDMVHVTSLLPVFTADLPNGKYRVTARIEGYGRRDWYKPDESYRVIAEREEKVAFKMTRDLMLSDDYLYRWWDHDFDPTEDAWEAYVRPVPRIRQFDVAVRDGQLSVQMPGALIYYMVVCPVSDAARVEREMERIDAACRKSFYFACYTYVDAADPNPVPEPTRQDVDRGFVLFARHYVDSCYPKSNPRPDERDPRSLTLLAAPGEYEPATIVVKPLRDLSRFDVRVSDLRSERGAVIPSSEIDVRYVRWRPRPKGLVWQPSPECLMRSRPAQLRPGMNRQFWLTVHAPDDARPGRYRGEATLASANGPATKLALEVKVLPFSLAALTTKHSWSYYTYPPQRLALRPEDRLTLARQFAESLKRHNMNAIQLPPPDIVNMKDAETFELDFADFDLVTEAALAAGLDGGFQVHTAGAAYYYFKRRAGGREFTPEFNRGFTKYLTLIRDHCRQRGWEPPLIWSVDEPRETGIHAANRNFVDTQAMNRLVKQVPGLRVTVTPMSDEGRGVDYTPMLDTLDVLQTHAWHRSQKLIDGARKRGMPWWSYNSGISRYSWGLQCFVLDAVGRWQWHYNSWSKYPHNPVARSRSYQVVYPSPDGLIPTVTFEIAREGADDYRYILTLQEAMEKAKRSGRDVTAADALLDEIRRLPPFAGRNLSGEGVGGYGANLFESAAGYDQLRRRIADEIVRLQGL